MKRLLAIAVLLLPGFADAEPWQGVWTADPAWCVNADRIGAATPAPILITAEQIAGYENTCWIRKVTPVGTMNAWHFTLECESEGSTYDDQTIVMIGDDNSIWQWFGIGEPVRFQRCPN